MLCSVGQNSMANKHTLNEVAFIVSEYLGISQTDWLWDCMVGNVLFFCKEMLKHFTF